MHKKVKLIVLSLFMMNSPAWSAKSDWFPPDSKTSIEALINPVHTQTYTSSGDFILPIREGKNSLLFSNFFTKAGSDDKWSLSGGGGFRQIIQNSFILGAYTYIDHVQTAHENSFWQLSPGVDYTTLNWDLHCNGYFPIGQNQKTITVSPSKSILILIDGKTYSPLYRKIEAEGPGIEAALGYNFRNFHHIHLTLVRHQHSILGYIDFSLCRAFSMLNCQLTPLCV